MYATKLFILPLLVYLALSSTGIASPTPDFASTLLQFGMFVLLTQGVAEWMKGARDHDYRVMVLVVLAATAVTIKLSNLGFSAVIFTFSLAYAWQRSRPYLRNVVHLLIPAAALILVWGF
ncbi:MAG: hypothetical protein GTO14_23435 [Anaerolineales bacterium]|nr:hypothetical protein [Anaerolineales bacterium]